MGAVPDFQPCILSRGVYLDPLELSLQASILRVWGLGFTLGCPLSSPIEVERLTSCYLRVFWTEAQNPEALRWFSKPPVASKTWQQALWSIYSLVQSLETLTELTGGLMLQVALPAKLQLNPSNPNLKNLKCPSLQIRWTPSVGIQHATLLQMFIKGVLLHGMARDKAFSGVPGFRSFYWVWV